jgi:hypothetical protein
MLLLYFNYFLEGMDMTTNIPDASATPMTIITQQASCVTIASFILTVSAITIVSAIPDGIQHDSTILA